MRGLLTQYRTYPLPVSIWLPFPLPYPNPHCFPFLYHHNTQLIVVLLSLQSPYPFPRTSHNQRRDLDLGHGDFGRVLHASVTGAGTQQQGASVSWRRSTYSDEVFGSELWNLSFIKLDTIIDHETSWMKSKSYTFIGMLRFCQWTDD